MTILRYLLAIAGLVGAGILPARRSIPGPAAVPLSVMFTVAGLGFGATTALVVPVPPMLAGVAVLFVMNAIAWRHVPTWRHQVGAPGGRALAVWAFAGAGAPMIVGSLTPATMFDARVTWFLHAHWLSGSQLRLLSAIRSPAFRYLNPDYPPAIPSAIAAVYGRNSLTHEPL